MFVQQIHQRADARYQSRRRKWLHSLNPGESLASSLMGIICLAISAIVLAVTFLAILSPIEPWTSGHEVLMEDLTQGPRVDPETRSLPSGPVMVVKRVIHLPATRCRVLALIGTAVGGAGLALGWRKGRLAWLSALGVALVAVAMLVNLARSL